MTDVGGLRVLRRRNKVCRDRECNCYCHWDLKGFSHCHPGRKCRDIECGCRNPITLHEITPPIADLFPTVTATRGGIQWGPTEQEPRRWERPGYPIVTVSEHLLGLKSERKRMYEVRVVIEEEGRPLVDVEITTTNPRQGINAAAKAADDAMKAHPDGPAEAEEQKGPGFSQGGLFPSTGPQVSHQPGGSRF